MMQTPFWRIVASGMVLVVAGCVAPAKGEAELDQWMGHDVNELIASWGPPTATRATPSGSRVLIWSTGRSFERPIPSKAIRNGNVAANDAYRTQTRSFGCTTSITIDRSGRISNWKRQGNKCGSS